jgi:hypothetical protein
MPARVPNERGGGITVLDLATGLQQAAYLFR